MDIARIISIKPDGTWNSQNGLMYQLLVTFDNNVTGQANAKSPTPPYKVGDEVGYEIKGTYPGGTKIKITAEPYGKGGRSGGQQSQAPARESRATAQPAQRQQERRQEQPPARDESRGNVIMGVTVGMAINNAVQILMSNARARQGHNDEGTLHGLVELSTLQTDIEQIALEILEASYRLENGKVVPQPRGEPTQFT